MSRVSCVVLLSLASCVPGEPLPAEPLPGWDAPATLDGQARVGQQLPQDMTLSLGAIVPGDVVLLTASGGTPGDQVLFLRGSPGQTCAPIIGGDCIGLSAPSLLGSAPIAASGEAVLAQVIPDTVPVSTVLTLQAVVASGTPYASQVAAGTAVSVCGDGVQQSDEACDDGDVLPGDGCDPQCELEVPSDDFDVEIIRADVATTHPVHGGPWDVDFFGLFTDPDPFYRAWVDGVLVYESNVAPDTLHPNFNDLFPITVSANETLTIDFWDDDAVLFPELIGTLEYTHADLNALAGTGPIVDSDLALLSVELEIH